MKHAHRIPAALLLFLHAASAAAAPLELTQIFGPAAVTSERAPSIRWIGDAYTTLETSTTVERGIDLVRHDAASGTRSVIARAETLSASGKPLEIGGYEWSPDGQRVLLKVEAESARRNNPVGDVWVLDVKSQTLRKLGGDLPAGSLLHAEFSPDGTRVAYLSGNNLFVESLDGKRTQLTSDGDSEGIVLNGRGDLAYEEEFSLGKAYAWSPDSRRIAYWQFDTRGVGTFYMIRNTDGQYSKIVPLQYPKPGTTNSAARVGTVSVDSPGTTWFRLEGDPRDNYVPRMDWAGNGREVLIQYEDRRQRNNRLLLGDVATGAVSPVMMESEKTWLLPSDDVRWLDGGRAFTWLSERDGWMHLWTVSRDGKNASLRTPGNYDVTQIEAIDEKAGYAYFLASADDVTQRFLYRATLRGTPRVERLTPANAPGVHDYDVSPNGRWAMHFASTADSPTRVDIVRLPAHESKRKLVENAKLRALVENTAHTPTEFFKVDIGDVVLDAWLVKPPAFDASKKYPLLVYVYSEPAGQTVVDRWGGDRHLWHLMLAQRGYLVASIDSRGAAAPRGTAWRRSIYGQIGVLASADQAAAIRKMMAERPYIDAKRIGVWGWSGGGAMTLNAMFRYPDLYSTGVAVASPVDQMLYNSIYQERYMGLPAENAAGYRDGSPINFAQNLAGNLLIIHGTGDDNVHYQNAETLVDRLIALNKPFSMMAYPNRTHGISEGANTRLHLFGLITRYLGTHLPAGPSD
jgi:dipeptidyl-peptidase-4